MGTGVLEVGSQGGGSQLCRVDGRPGRETRSAAVRKECNAMTLSPGKRQTIIKLSRTPDGWHGRVNGCRATVKINWGRHGEVSVARWRVCKRRHWAEGMALTTWDAIEAIEFAIRHDFSVPLF
jgi:hypothetical protein